MILHDVYGTITYKGEGVFIARSAGISPFISIFRDFHLKNEIGNNKLIFAYKIKADILLENEFTDLSGDNFIKILSQEKTEGYANGQISADFRKVYVNDSKPVCMWAPPIMDAI